MSIALANAGDLQIELIQQRNDAPSMYKEFLDSGREGLQHVAFWSTDYQSLYDRALGQGYKLGHEGQIGGEQGRFAYFDTGAPADPHAGTVIEISDISGNKGRFFERIRGRARTWDGSGPIRRPQAPSVARAEGVRDIALRCPGASKKNDHPRPPPAG